MFTDIKGLTLITAASDICTLPFTITVLTSKVDEMLGFAYVFITQAEVGLWESITWLLNVFFFSTLCEMSNFSSFVKKQTFSRKSAVSLGKVYEKKVRKFQNLFYINSRILSCFDTALPEKLVLLDMCESKKNENKYNDIYFNGKMYLNVD